MNGELNEVRKLVENVIAELKAKNVPQPYKMETGLATYEVLENDPYIKKLPNGLLYYSMVDGTRIFVLKPQEPIRITPLGDIKDFVIDAQDYAKMFNLLKAQEAVFFKPLVEPIPIEPEQSPLKGLIDELIANKKKREIYIPEKLKRKRIK